MAATTTTTLTELVPQIESEAMLWLQSASLFYPDKGNATRFLRWADLRNTPGDAYRFNEYAEIEMYDAVEGENFTVTQAMDTSGTTVTTTEKEVVVPVTDKVRRSVQQGPAQLIVEIGEAIGRAAAKKFDADVIALFGSLGSCLVTTDNPITNALFQQYIATLAGNNAPMPYAAFFHPWTWFEYVTESSSPVPDSAKSGPVGEGIWTSYFVQSVMGVQCYQYGDMPTTNSDTDYDGAFLSNRAIGAVLKMDLKLEESREAVDRLTNIVGVMDYGVGVIDSTAGYQMFADAD